MPRWIRSAMLPGLVGFQLLLVACQEEAPESAAAGSEVRLVELASVGALDGDEREVFGRIAGVRAGGNGSFFVLDAQAAALERFDRSGSHLGGVRDRGAGPGELAEPTALHVLDEQTVVVVDPPNGRYTFYAYDSEGVRYDRSVSGPPASAICSIGERLFLHGNRGGDLIHELGSDGEVVRSFDAAVPASQEEYGPATPRVTSQRNSGLLLCLEDPELVVAISTYVPTVRAYSPDGVLQWEVEMDGFRLLEFAPVPEGGVRFESPEEGYHVAISAVEWSDRSVLVQYSLSWPEDMPVDSRDRDFFAIESRELDLSSGREVARFDSLPLVVDRANGLYYSFENLPIPRGVVFERDELL